METRARYTLIGLFSLAVIAAGFTFVYWLKSAGGLGQRDAYRVRYEGTVAGLMKGSIVLFNGVRVGEVTSLDLDTAEPGVVTVSIAVERRAPVRADTKASIDFQGLAGAPAVSLTGGTGTAALAPSPNGAPPLLVAERNAGQSLTQAARGVLQQIGEVVEANAAPLKATVANVERFSGALARNSDKVDGIVAGIERMTGGGAKGPARIVDLPPAPAAAFQGLSRRPEGQLVVSDPTTLGALDSDRLQVRGGEKPSLDGAQWPDLLTKLVQARLVQSFENAGFGTVMARAPDGVRTEFQLLTDIRRFQVQAGAESTAEVELAGRLVAADGRVVGARLFRATAPVSAVEPQAAAKALGEAFGAVAADLVRWALGTL